MRILVDLTSIAGGGGLEQCKSLLGPLVSMEGVEVLCVVRTGTPIHDFVMRSGAKYVSVSNHLAARAWMYFHRMSQISRKHKIDFLYVPFGIGSLRRRSTTQIINVAYPIICYPDSPFWSYLPFWLRIKNGVKSFVRRISIAWNADVVVVESAVMAERLANYSVFRRTKIIVMPPVIGQVASRLRAESNSCASLSAAGRLRLLYVSGASQHKNIWRIGEMLHAVRSSSNADVEIAVTVSQEEYRRCCMTAGVRDYIEECSDRIIFLGRIHGEYLIKEIMISDIIMNISDLESISNNYIESEACLKPMLISDRDFALSSVRTNHVICEPHDTASFVRAIDAYIDGDIKSPRCSGELAISASVKAKMLKNLFQDMISLSE